ARSLRGSAGGPWLPDSRVAAMSKKRRGKRKRPAMSNANTRAVNPLPSPPADDRGAAATGSAGAAATVPPTTTSAPATAPPPPAAPTPSAPPAPAGGAGASAATSPATPATAGAVAAKSVPPLLFVLNFLVLGVVLTGMLAWFFFYTNWFEGILTLLGL